MPRKDPVARRDYDREWKRQRRKDPAYALMESKAAATTQAARRLEVLAAYGGKCACCGEAEPRFLTIDHVNNDGAEHRRKHGLVSGTMITSWLKKQGYPEGFQIPCYNCNNAKALGGCPHQKVG